ncbi:uncharacterized protein LOC125140039 isoform X2 [Tachysurus fulvidraco]|uniref:uncharacterized protein LOC113655322 isoform X2 n=1 Tax=Tachysurus fulvidraco TaxID=1234273 RepID=UPI001FEFE37C|nr:uncharacterized protein LOC113655322 isoform X2 [Tachysurus fulvidraco]XP_047663084.1 uncharacterized protein LOC125140039 isoform X2 [Tachysurus fulvidraco]
MQESSGINLFVVRHFKLREVHSTTMVPEQRRVTSMTLNRRCQITCSRQPASPPQLLHLHQPSSTMRSLVVLMFICMLLPKGTAKDLLGRFVLLERIPASLQQPLSAQVSLLLRLVHQSWCVTWLNYQEFLLKM